MLLYFDLFYFTLIFFAHKIDAKRKEVFLNCLCVRADDGSETDPVQLRRDRDEARPDRCRLVSIVSGTLRAANVSYN